MNDTRIRPATEADAEAISRLADVIWRAHYPGVISPEQIEFMLARMYALDTLRGEMRTGGIRYELLSAGGELSGFASFGPAGPPGVFKLHKLYLRPALHGRGLGSRLLRHCEDEACKLGARRLILAVNKRNTKAIAAYERNGFTIAESVCVDIGGGFVMDDFVMAKELDSTAADQPRKP